MNVTDRMSHFNVPGASVTYFEGGEIAWSKHFGTLEQGSGRAVDDNSIFHACSMSKMITAICVLKLAQDEELDLHRDVNEYLTSWKVLESKLCATKKVTLANLLAHQGGFVDAAGSFGHFKGGAVPSQADILRDTMVKYEPETDCEYSDAGYCIINQVLIDVLGEDVSQLADWIIFKPLGLTRSFFWEAGKDEYEGISMNDCAFGHDKRGNVVKEKRAAYVNAAGAGLWTSTRELASIIIDLLKAYQGKGGVVLKQDMARLMLTPYGCTDDVGLGVFLAKDRDGEACFVSQGWGVGMQCKLRAYIDGQRGVIVMTNSDPGIEQNDSLVGELIRFVCDEKGFA